MPDWSFVNRSHVLKAMGEYDELGDREFLRRYGLRRARATALWHRGTEYDPTALLGAAHFHATGSPVPPTVLRDRERDVADTLARLGFDVVVDEEALAALPPPRPARVSADARVPKGPTPARGAAGSRAAAAPKPRKVAPPPPRICPTCHMATPASGICDFCD